jgi:plasmid stability protein
VRTTLTIRTDEKLREALRKRAALQGKTVSELAREILSEALEERPMIAQIGHLQGRLKHPSDTSDAWRKKIRERNWRPIRARRDAEVTRRLNELFAEPEIEQEQARSVSELDAAGTDWSDERW